MADLLGNGLAWLSQKRHEHMTQAVTYTRGSDEIELSATKARAVMSEVGDESAYYDVHATDWIVRSADLEINGVAIEPQVGDRITEVMGDATYVYEVMSTNLEPCFVLENGRRHSLRIHTKVIDR